MGLLPHSKPAARHGGARRPMCTRPVVGLLTGVGAVVDLGGEADGAVGAAALGPLSLLVLQAQDAGAVQLLLRRPIRSNLSWQ